MDNILTYGSIFVFSLILIAGLSNLENFSLSFGGQKGGKIIIVVVLLMSYFSVVIFPVNSLLKTNILSKKLLQGDKGPRGNRGKAGEPAICNTCGDDLCLKKILFNITNTYNYWRSLNGLDLYPDTYVIKNQFLKDKIMKHCKSDEFQKIIKKYGSNNRKDCPEGLDSCGIYDYLFKMWSVWILIILKYKNGYFFLESESLTDKDFDGLIEKEDSFQLADIVKYNNSEINYKIDSVKDLYPFFVIRNTSNSKKYNAHINEIKLQTEPVHENGKKIWDPFVYSYSNMFAKKDIDYNVQTHGVNVKTIKQIKDKDGNISFDAPDFNDEFFKVQGTPSRGKLSPFDEIEKYKSWYWGRSELLKPKIVIKNPSDSKLSLKQKSCYNDKKIKVKNTNNFYEVFSTKKITQNYTAYNALDPFKILGSNSVSFLRAKKYVDPNEHHYFKTYKPVGDILVKESEILKMSDGKNKQRCSPNTYDHVSEISVKLADVNTILVSGDVKAPIDYQIVYSSVKTRGINKYAEGFTIWRPVPPEGYKSLGYIIDNRPYPIKEKPPKPGFDVVVCVPSSVTLDIKSNLESIWKSNGKTIDNQTYSQNIQARKLYKIKQNIENQIRIGKVFEQRIRNNIRVYNNLNNDLRHELYKFEYSSKRRRCHRHDRRRRCKHYRVNINRIKIKRAKVQRRIRYFENKQREAIRRIKMLYSYLRKVENNLRKLNDYSNARITLDRNTDIYTFKLKKEPQYKINQLELCKTYEQVLKEQPEEPIFKMPQFPKRTQIKDQKYSILRLYND